MQQKQYNNYIQGSIHCYFG